MSESQVSPFVLKATLGGLVHDLGKPWSQVPGRPPDATRFDCETPKEHRGRLQECPSCKRYGSAHAPLGASLLQHAMGTRFSYLQELALAHHGTAEVVKRTGDVLRYVIFGDRLSAGERDEWYDRDEAEPRPALLNPFAVDRQRVVTPAPLTDAGALLKQPGRNLGHLLGSLVEWQKEALRQAAEFAGGDERWLVDHLLGAVESSASLVPSAFRRDVADIALASHLQFAGAFAGALAAGGVSPDIDLKTFDGPIATLVLGDLSGIQAFLHRVASKRAARSLRARSFYLGTLSLVLSRVLAERLGVTSAHVLSSVGGNFLVLGPPGCEERVEAVATEIDAALAETHGAALSVSVACMSLRPGDTGDFSRALAELRRRLRDVKARRAERTAARLGLFEPRGDGGPLKACRSCGGDASDGIVEDDDRVCRFCWSLEELGRRLPEASYLILEDSDGEEGQGPEWQRVARRLGVTLKLEDHPPQPPVAGAVYALSADDVKRVKCARLLPSGRYVPVDKKEVLDFQDLAGRAKGRPLLAVLKADVDDLGRTFATHFQRNGRSVQSPSRVATFMRFLALFFEGRVNDLAEREFPNLYVVFAGGDDLAVVGPWDDVLTFAERIRTEFRQWTGENPNFHFSAGIAFGDATRPVIAALQEAEALLGVAKNRPGKDAVAVFQVALPWDQFVEMLRWYEELAALIGRAGEAEGVARSLLQRLKRLDALTEPRGGKVVYGPELWRAYYSLKRFAQRHEQAHGHIRKMYDHALDTYGGVKLAMAARLAEFATTSGKGGNAT